MTEDTLTPERIDAARARIGEHVNVTPLRHAYNLSRQTGIELFLKLENLQVTGSFKERGAVNRLLTLDAAERANGVIAASAGNHAQGVSLHATRLGIDSVIVMPEHTPLVKVARTRRYGADVVLHGGNYDEAGAYARDLAASTGRTMIHAFDDLEVMAGQGTIGLELLEQGPQLDAVIVPIGGGGLISGIAVAIKAARPEVEIIGVQTAAYPSMLQALERDGPVELPPARTIADGIAVRRAGGLTFACVRRWVDRFLTVSEEDIARAILLLMEEEKVVAEGAGAVALAAVLSGTLSHLEGRSVALLVCGGNIDMNLVADIIERGLVKLGRRVQLEVKVPDRPGTFAQIARIVAEQSANVLEIRHDRAFSEVSMGETDIILTLETRGFDDIAALRERLEAEGFRVRRPRAINA